jgi:hypothetical protein
MGWNSKPQQNSNGLELQATVKFEWVGTPSHGEIQIARISIWSEDVKQNSKARAQIEGHECLGDVHFGVAPAKV